MKTLINMAVENEPGAAGAGKEAPISLRQRVQSGGAVMMGGFGFGQALRLVSNLILTRLIMPEAFGLMAVAVAINIWAVMLIDIGIGASVVRSRNSEDPDFIRTAWTMQIMRNLLVWLIIMFAALAVYSLARAGLVNTDGIYANPVLPWIMAVIGLQLPLVGLSSTNRAMAERRLAMKRIIGLEIATQLIMMATTISLALMGYGVWALVIGSLIGAAFSAGASHLVFPGPRMAIHFNRRYFDEIFNFGKWLIIASFFGFIIYRGDQLLFGWYMEAEKFSLYAVASIWIMAAMMVAHTLIRRIMYPAFSEIIRERPSNLGSVYGKVRLIADGGAFGAAFGAYFLAEPIFGFIYPDNYGGVGYYVKLLSPMLLFLPFQLINTAVLAAGDSKGFTGVTVLAGAAMIIFVPLIFSTIGEKAAIVYFACIAATSLPIVWRLGAKYMTINFVTEGRMIAAALVLVSIIVLRS